MTDNNGIFEQRKIESPRYYFDIGYAHHKAGRLDDAMHGYDMALALDADYVPALGNRAEIYHRQFRYAEAFADYQKALTLNPNISGGWVNFGNLLLYLNDTPHAIDCMENAIKTDPTSALAWHGLACAYGDAGRDDEAITAANQAIHLDPLLNTAYGNRAAAKLRLGMWDDAWGDFQYRKQVEGSIVNDCTEPRWDGVSKPENLVLFLEQGLGDVFMCMKSACALAEQGQNVTVLANPRFTPLLSTAPGVKVVPYYGELPQPFVWLPIMDAIRWTGATPDHVPGPAKWLSADPGRIDLWNERLGAHSEFKIGIFNSTGHKNHHGAVRRSIPIKFFEPLSTLPGVKLFSLQKPEPDALPDWIERVPGRDNDDAAPLFADTAACMMNMNLVISTDSSPVHLAGALGIRTFLPLAKHAEWRWGLDRSDSPWYPTLKMFRQREPGDWAQVIDDMRKEIPA